MKDILLIVIFAMLCASCQSQNTVTGVNAPRVIYKYVDGKFLLLDSISNRMDTILIDEAWGVDEVIDVKMSGNKCILIYRNNTVIAFNAFEKGEKWHSSLGQVLTFITNQTGHFDFKIIDENHVQVKEIVDQSRVPIKERKLIKKTNTYELNYTEKKVSVTETIEH